MRGSLAVSAALIASVGVAAENISAASTPQRPDFAVTTTYQPDLTVAEDLLAVALARRDTGIDSGDAVAIMAYPPEGGFFRSRLAYVSFHADADADPYGAAFVDLTHAVTAPAWGALDHPPPSVGSRSASASWPAAHDHGVDHDSIDADADAGIAERPAVAMDPVAGWLGRPPSSIEWGGWSFTNEVSGFEEGLALRNVRFRGHLIADKVAMPVMTVFYDKQLCGPFADRIGRPLPSIDWAADEEVAYRELVIDGQPWREIGVRAVIGDYDLFQSFVFSPDGIIEARLAGSGLQCLADHQHFPTFLVVPAIDGAGGERAAPSGGNATAVEADADVGIGWQLTDGATSPTIKIAPASLNVGVGAAAPVTPERAAHRIGVRRYRPTEDAGWRTGARRDLPFFDGERIDNGPIAVWYQAVLSHAAAAGAEHWHVGGMRLTIALPANETAGLTLLSAASATQAAKHATRSGISLAP